MSKLIADDAERRYPTNGGTRSQILARGDKREAYRHLMWSASLTYSMGRKDATSWEEAHENGDTSADHFRDEGNNAIGNAIGERIRAKDAPMRLRPSLLDREVKLTFNKGVYWTTNTLGQEELRARG